MHSESTQPRESSRHRRVRFLILLPCAFLCLSLIIWFTTKPREPMYQGQPLSYWISRIQESGAPWSMNANAIECRDAIRAIGTNAFPTILRILRAKDSKVKTILIDLAERQSLVSVPFHSVEERQSLAQPALELLGDLSTNIVPQLVEISRSSSCSPYAQGIAGRALMNLYPILSVPYWEAPGKRARWYRMVGGNLMETGGVTNAPIAIKAFSQGLELEPTNQALYELRAQARLHLDQYANALADYSKALELSPTNAEAQMGLAVCHFGLKHFAEAEAQCNTLIQNDTNNFRALKVRALVRANLRKLQPAIDDLNDAIAINDHDSTLFRYRSVIKTMQLEFESALADASKAVQLDPSDAGAWTARSRVVCALKDYYGAITNADVAIRLGPATPEGYTIRATARLCRNEFSSAAEDLQKAFSLNPSNFVAYVDRAVLRMKQGGEDELALADFKRAVELAPEIAEPYGMLGLFQFKIGDVESAFTNCRKAIDLGAIANLSSYNSYLWLMRAQAGRISEANAELDHYLNSLQGSKTNEWPAVTARFFTGKISETEFLRLAATVLKRPSGVTNQICESFYYAGMKRKLAGDTSAARDFFQKCVNVKDDNCMAYLNARIELARPKAE